MHCALVVRLLESAFPGPRGTAMKRAGVFIGVDKTGALPRLNDAAKGANRMADWARAQGMDPVVVCTDEGGKAVEIREIKKAITAMVDKGTIDQLIIYFAGHGVNIGGTERWLLTDAPKDTGAAVNLNGSAEIAHGCGIPHVVFLSDACRTAAKGIQAQRVTGSEIFPNEAPSGPEKAVDRFWACLVGDPAAEVEDPNVTSKEYRALYTDELVDALAGKKTEVLEADGTNAVVRPTPLKRCMPSAVAGRIKSMNLQTRLIQVPDARITSDSTAWISRVPLPAGGLPPKPAAPGPGVAQGGKGLGLFGVRTSRLMDHIETVSASLVRAAMSGVAADLPHELDRARTGGILGASALLDSVARTSQTFGPTHFESQCGFKLRGAGFKEVYSGRAKVAPLTSELVRAEAVASPGANVLLVFHDGSGAVLPAIPGFVAALTVESGGLVDVTYEPSDNSPRWNDFVYQAIQVRTLRALAASATRSGVFRLEGEDAPDLARLMQNSKGTVPTLAIYAAYAYLDLRQHERIREMSRYMRAEFGSRWFDIAMLAGELDGGVAASDQEIFSFVPLLAQGWALLSAHRIKLPAALEGLQETLVPSVWTTFSPEGIGQLRRAFQSGEVRL